MKMLCCMCRCVEGRVSILSIYSKCVDCLSNVSEMLSCVACIISTLNSQGWYRGIQLFKMADMQMFPPPEYTPPHQI